MEQPQPTDAPSKPTLSWPDDAALYQPVEADQMLLPERASCLAVKTFLHMCELPYTTVLCTNAESMSPGGRLTKLPFLRMGDCVFPEFEPIVSYVNERNLGPSQCADESAKHDICSHVAYVENTYTLAGLYMCFINSSVYEEVTTARKNTVYPWPFNLIQNFVRRNSAMETLRVYEWHELSLGEVVEIVDKCSKELSNILEEHPDRSFFGGERPCELDAIVFGHLQTILTAELPNMALAQTISKYERLMQFCQLIDEKYSKPFEEQQQAKQLPGLQAINETMCTKVSHEAEGEKPQAAGPAEESHETDESQESRETEESQGDSETEDSQESSFTEDSQESQESKESQETEESRETSETEETQDSQEVEESQESRDTDDTQESRDTEETQESRGTADESQESQESEESEQSDESQDSQETQESQESDGLAASKQTAESQKSEEPQKSPTGDTELELPQDTKEGPEVNVAALALAEPREAQADLTPDLAQLPREEVQQPQQEQEQQQQEAKLQGQEDKLLETTKNA